MSPTSLLIPSPIFHPSPLPPSSSSPTQYLLTLLPFPLLLLPLPSLTPLTPPLSLLLPLPSPSLLFYPPLSHPSLTLPSHASPTPPLSPIPPFSHPSPLPPNTTYSTVIHVIRGDLLPQLSQHSLGPPHHHRRPKVLMDLLLVRRLSTR